MSNKTKQQQKNVLKNLQNVRFNDLSNLFRGVEIISRYAEKWHSLVPLIVVVFPFHTILMCTVARHELQTVT